MSLLVIYQKKIYNYSLIVEHFLYTHTILAKINMLMMSIILKKNYNFDPLEQFGSTWFIKSGDPDRTTVSMTFESSIYHKGWFVATNFFADLHDLIVTTLNSAFSSGFLFIFCLIPVIVSFYMIVNTPEKNVNNVSSADAVTYLFNVFSSISNSILRSNTTLERKEQIYTVYFLFVFIFICNVFGLIPFSYTLTSNFIVTFFLAGTHFLAINIIAFYKHGWKFFSLFLPSGVPIFIAPFLVLIEMVSYTAKVFSLSIRLFANMMSGHALLKILIGFSWTMLASGGVLTFGAVFPWLIVTLIFFLELLIAFLQAYVFVVLVSIYINDIFSAH